MASLFLFLCSTWFFFLLSRFLSILEWNASLLRLCYCCCCCYVVLKCAVSAFFCHLCALNERKTTNFSSEIEYIYINWGRRFAFFFFGLRFSPFRVCIHGLRVQHTGTFVYCCCCCCCCCHRRWLLLCVYINFVKTNATNQKIAHDWIAIETHCSAIKSVVSETLLNIQ